MNNQRQFIAQQGSNTTVKVYDATTGQLWRVISVGGTIVSSPVASGSTMTVTVELPSGQAKQAKIYALPSGGLIRSIPLGNKP